MDELNNQIHQNDNIRAQENKKEEAQLCFTTSK
jgi:hypothetical protein